jgi:hypothetical protein
MGKIAKLKKELITRADIAKRKARAIGMGYDIPKWLQFCEEMLDIGYKVTVYEVINTHSKYVRVYGAGDTSYQVRFSNHKPNRRRELAGDCDFFVGVTHTGTRTTRMAVEAVKEYFNAL